jgi:hypothetical protein
MISSSYLIRFSLWIVRRFKTTSFNVYVYIKKKEVGSQPGLPGSPGFRVNPLGRPGFARPTPQRVSPGQLLNGFLLRPEPVPGPGWPGPGSTRRASPGFKTMVVATKTVSQLFFEKRKSHLLSFPCIYTPF